MKFFSLLVGMGASLGMLQLVRRAPEKQQLRYALAGLMVLTACLIGARLNYALLHPALFAAAPLDILRFWLGGLSWPGALIFGLLALVGVSLALRLPFEGAADLLMPLFPTVAITAWLGCSQAGCAYGSQIPETSTWALRMSDEQGLLAYRWPLQLAGAVSLLLVVWRVELFSSGGKKPAGWRASALGLALALHTLLFSWLRADSPLAWQGLRLDLAAAGALGAASLLGFGLLGLRKLRASQAEKSLSAGRESLPSPRD